MTSPLKVFDPAPWFDATTVAGASTSLGVVAGRWVVLCFLNALDRTPGSLETLAELLGEARLFQDDHMVFYGVVTERPQEVDQLAQVSHKALGFIADYNAAITRLYDAAGAPCVIVLDPLLRIMARFPIGSVAPSTMRNYLRGLPSIDQSAGVPLTAPALVVPPIFEPEVCRHLIELYEAGGSVDSGFMLDRDGKTSTVVNYALKRRNDLVINDEPTRSLIRERIAQRLVPAIERFFQYRPTRMDRYLVSCYDAAIGGHFSRHRDNVNAGARHRRFAVTVNFNSDYEGCDLIFPEFGRRQYRAPEGGAIVFSCGALHEVTQITRGRRYAFIPFLYGEADAKLREAQNAQLGVNETHYIGGRDKLFPQDAAY